MSLLEKIIISIIQLLLKAVGRLPQAIKARIVPNMLIPSISNNPSKVQLAKLGHVYFEHPDLSKFRKFAHDFGFVEVEQRGDSVFFRGYGEAPFIYVATQSKDKTARFLGPAFVARSQEEFDKAASLPGAKPRSLKDCPGGGQMVSFDRADDTYFHVVFGQEMRELDAKTPSATHESLGPANTPFEKPRKGKFQRFHNGPALIHKLGHLGYVHRYFDQELKWYTDNFNFVPSDNLFHWDFDNVDVLSFLHIDLGEEYSDHHIFFLQRSPPEVRKTYLHHSSYEVEDFDTQLIGHEWLASKGWKSVWGVGRHILGSQIFDYWCDPSGFKIEHYADGDLVNTHTETRREVVGPLSIWGPELPKDFGEDGTKFSFQ